MNSIIKSTVLNVTQRFLKQESKTNRKLDSILNKKFEKVELNEVKYIELLKYNVLFYKTLSRNTEPIISKWILEKYIPDIDELESDIELINAKCRKYINIAKRDGIQNLKEADLQSFNYYDKMENSEKIKRLQKDYKVLNIYMEVLTMTLRELSLRKEDSVGIFQMNPADARMELKREIIVIVNRILAGGSKKEESVEENNSVEEEPKKDLIDSEFLRRVKLISNAELNDCVEEEFKRILTLENLEAEEAYGFGGRVIYEFAAATVLLEFVKSRTLIEGAMRLTVAGEFGEENFGEFINAVIKDRKLVEMDTWKEACKYFRDNKSCVEATTPATIKRTLPADIDMDEYAYMLENADKSEPFRNKLSRRIDPSLVIPAVRIKEVEPEDVEIVEETTEEIDDVAVEEVVSEDVIDGDVASNNEVVEMPSNDGDDHEIHTNPARRREAIKNIERQELEAERAERLRQEEAEKLNDPVERAKKAVDELKKEISEVDSDDVEAEEIEEVVVEEAPVSEANEEEDDLQEISRIAGINESKEEEIEEEEEEPKKRGIFSFFGRKKDEEDDYEDEDEEYEEDEYYSEEEAVEEDTQESAKEEPRKETPNKETKESNRGAKVVEEEAYDDEEEIEYVDDDYEGDDVEIEEEVVIVKDEAYKKSRKKLDLIIAVLIVAIAAGGYFLTINRKRQREAEKQQQIKQEQQLEQQKKEEERRKKAEAEKIAAEEAKRAAEIEKAKQGGEYYRVYAGSLKDKGHAESLVANLNKKNLKGEIIKIGNYYKVFVGGDTGVYSEAKKQLSSLKAKGFDGYIEKYDRYCDLKIEDFRLKAKTMDKAQVEEAYNTLKEELKSRRNFKDYDKIMAQTYEEIMAEKAQ
ncbi:SPOR domain-containing protein [Peptacetobacter sp. AB845]|uniref:SPOR domain-containing protein n=1 Tax=Peptacetobacter sp. AB845 TaxID=3388429 RepID=UPI0039C9DBB6